MTRQRLKLLLRILTLVFWAVFWWKASWWFRHGGDLRFLPRALRGVVLHAGVWGPFAVLGAYVLRTFLLVPSTIVEIAVGTIYGPFWGSLLNLVGLNLSANIAFWLGRFLGRDFLSKHEHGLIKAYDEAMARDGFSAVLAMRLLFVPFDVINYGAGMTGIKYRDYVYGTALGLIPAAVAFTVAGDNIGKPNGFIVFVVLGIAILGLLTFLKRHPWIKTALSRNIRHEN